jgi:CelD/BcsL family acetyltransferase involved in cellulose biosynthesis
MRLEVIQSLKAVEALSDEWNDLLSCCSASHVPFLRNEYLTTWWKTLGGGEWQHGELFVITAHDEDEGLAGIAPLFFTQNREGEPAMLLIGSIEISDYLDLIVRTKALPQFMDQLLDLLASDQAPSWKVLDLYNLPDYSPTLAALQEAAERRGWIYQQQALQKSPYITLPGDWETYLAGIDKKQRHEIRRKIRRAEENEVPVRWYIVEDETTLDHEIEEFLGLMAQDPEKERFLTPAMRTQMHLAVQAAFKGGWLQFAFLVVGGEKAAGYLNFDYHGHIWVYNSGLNFNFREISPGWVLLGYLLQWANEHQRAAFDFMRGDEEYKYRFGAIDRYIYRATVRRKP